MPASCYLCTKKFDAYIYCFFIYFLSLLTLSEIGMAGIIVYDGNFDIEEFSDLEVPFTQSIGKDGIQGVIVAADPPHACVNISRPPDLNASLNWFVLIAGNLCDYETKVIYAKLSGYSAAVIYSFRGRHEGPYKIPSGHNYIYANISAVIIRTLSGLKIKENYLYTIDQRFRIFIYPNNSFNIMTFLLLFAIIAGLFLIIMLAFTVARFVQESQSNGNSRLSSRHLRQLQTSRFCKGDRYDTCAICLEDYKDRDKLRILPCFHGYHTKCIDPWLINNQRICPVCKQKVVLSGEISESTSDSTSDSRRTETTPLLSNPSGRIAAHGTFNSMSIPSSIDPGNNMSGAHPTEQISGTIPDIIVSSGGEHHSL